MATFTNQAQLTYSGRTVLSNTVTGEITEPIIITKTALIGEYNADDVITYVVTLTNSGQTAVGNVTLTDDLGAYEYSGGTLVPLDYTVNSVTMITNGVPQTAPTVTSTNPLTLTGLTIPAGGNVIIIYETTTNAYTPVEAAGTVTNTVTASSPELVENVTASEVVSAANLADLSIIKSLSPSTVFTSGTVTYNFVIENSGNTEAPTDVVITDTFDPALGSLIVEFNGTTWTEGTEYNYDPATGEFATTAGAIPVPAATITQDTQTGEYIVTPGTATLTVSGTF